METRDRNLIDERNGLKKKIHNLKIVYFFCYTQNYFLHLRKINLKRLLTQTINLKILYTFANFFHYHYAKYITRIRKYTKNRNLYR